MAILKDQSKKFIRRVFETLQPLGIDLLPRHFYSQVPSIARLKATQSWRSPLSMHGVAGADIKAQIANLNDLFKRSDEIDWDSRRVYEDAVAVNGERGGYGPIEACVLFAYIVAYRPQRIVQVGCGVSTAIILEAAHSCGHSVTVTAIEPHPSEYLRSLAKRQAIDLIVAPAEETDLDVYLQLKRGDLLFVDSTHCVRPGSEVNRIILEVLPRLAGGVVTHFHDIYYPFDYSRNLLSDELFFQSESTLLHAFLIDNRKFRVLLSLSQIHYAAPESLQAYVPHYRPQTGEFGLGTSPEGHFPSSLYLVQTQ